MFKDSCFCITHCLTYVSYTLLPLLYSFVCDLELQIGELEVSADHSNTAQEPRLNILVRYHRRIEGKIV
jgi:hypothetical protein